MKIYWSAFYCLLMLTALVGCGSEQFGSTPKTTTESVSPLKTFSSNTCSTFTLIKPKVDVVYVVDNSSSNYYIPSNLKAEIIKTVDRLSTDFDYRVIGTPLLETAEGDADYQVMTNSADPGGLPTDSRRISNSSAFNFFNNANNPPLSGVEKGLGRVVSFVNTHRNSLLRSDAYTLIVLVSNGRDLEVEEDKGTFNGETKLNVTNYNARLASFRSLRQSLNATQFRLISATAKSVCQSGWRSSNLSYVKMANQLYLDSLAQDSSVQDSHDLCGNNISAIFSSVNDAIRQVIRPHEYRYWPITFAENNESVSINEIRVQKIMPDGSSIELTRDMEWFYEDRGTVQTVQSREGPNPVPGPGEPITGRHFIRFSNLVTYPDCVLVTSVSRTEFFDYVVLPQKPIIATLSIRINGRVIPKSSTNGWTDETSTQKTINIKAPHPTPADENPPVMRTGFMIKLNGINNYYKSGDSIEVNYNPAGV